jgi:hypothetical protein
MKEGPRWIKTCMTSQGSRSNLQQSLNGYQQRARLVATRKKGSEHCLIVQLTPEQQALIQECTGKTLDTLNLEGCQDRLIVDRLRGPQTEDAGNSRFLILELTSEQKDKLRLLTGKSFSEVKIRRRLA